MKSEELLTAFQNAKMAVFTSKDVERVTNKRIAYVSLYISRLLKRNKLIRIERGKYCLPNTSVYEIASNLVFPSYVSLFAAFRLYGLTTQGGILTIDVITTKRHRKVNFEGYTIRFITIERERFFGFQRMQNTEILAALPEKAIVDAVYLNNPNEAYTYEAIKNGLKKGLVNKDKLIAFAKEIRSKKTLKKVNSLIAEAEAGE